MKPQKLKRVPLKEELVALTGDFVKALILQQFLYWSERVIDFDDFIIEEKERLPGLEIELRHGWIYKSTEQLHDELMFGESLSPRTVKRRLDEIVNAGYLVSRNNPDHKWDRCLQYRPDIQKIQTDLQKMGFALEKYPLIVTIYPFATVTNADDNVSNREDAVSNQSVASVEAIPETTPETTPESLKASSAKADYNRSISLLSEKEIKALKLPLSAWQQHLADEKAERKRIGVLRFLEGKISTGPLLPDSPAAHTLFGKLAIEAKAKGRRPPQKFPTLAVKKKFSLAANDLNGTLEAAIIKALESGITSIPRIVNYISSPKWQENKYAHQNRTNDGASQTSNKADGSSGLIPVGSGQTPEMRARLLAAFSGEE